MHTCHWGLIIMTMKLIMTIIIIIIIIIIIYQFFEEESPITPNLCPQRFRTSLFRDSYFNRIVLIWNNLPLVIRQCQSYSTFKAKLYKYYYDKLDNDFDPDRPRTWKTICPNCRTVNRIFCCWVSCILSVLNVFQGLPHRDFVSVRWPLILALVSVINVCKM